MIYTIISNRDKRVLIKEKNIMENKNYEHELEKKENRKEGGYLSLFNPLISLLDNSFSSDFYSTSNIMKTDVIEKKDEYIFNVEMPGVDKKNISIDLEKGYLKISYKSKREERNEEEKTLRSERYYGSFSRSYFIGYDISKDNIKAKLEDGVLKVVVKKPVEEKEKENSIVIE